MRYAGLFALSDRALRVQSRSLLQHLLRLGLVALAWLLLCWAQLISLQMGAPGLWFLTPVLYVTLFLLGLLGLAWFGTMITEEKEAGTLPLLRLSGMGGFSILLGKLVGRLGPVVLFLALQLPFAMLAVGLGGLTHMQVLAAYQVLLGYAVFLGGFGMLCSCCFRRGLVAVAVAVVLHLGYLIVGPLIAAGFWSWPAGLRHHPLLAAHPYTALADVFSVGYDGSLAHWYLWVNVGLGLLCFLAAWPVFATVGDRERSGSGFERLFLRRGRSRRVRGNAFLWKDWVVIGQGRLGVAMRMGLGLVTIGIILGLFVLTGGPRSYRHLPAIITGTALWTGYLLTVVGIGYELAHSFAVERRRGTFPALMVTPVPIARHYWGKVGCVLLTNLVYPVLAAVMVLGLLALQWIDHQLTPLPGRWGEVSDMAGGFFEAVFANGFVYIVHGITILFWSLCPFFGTLLRWGGFVVSVAGTVVILMVLYMVVMIFFLIIFFAVSSSLGRETAQVLIAMVSLGVGLGLGFLFHWLTLKVMYRLCTE